jgi:hypothetical protein
MSEETDEDRRIKATAAQLRSMKQVLGERYWQSEDVRALQQNLNRMIGAYGAWGETKLPMHQRARLAARHESENADLLWPGGAGGG